MPRKAKKAKVQAPTKKKRRPGWVGLGVHVLGAFLVGFLAPALSLHNPLMSGVAYLAPAIWIACSLVCTLWALLFWTKAKWWHLMVLAYVVIGVAGFRPVPPRPMPETGLRVMTFNCLGTKNLDKEALVEYIEKNRIDILCLQESRHPDTHSDLGEELAEQLDGWTAVAGRETSIVTRLPVRSSRIRRSLLLNPRDTVSVDLGGDKPLTVVNAHFPVPYFLGKWQGTLGRIERGDKAREQHWATAKAEIAGPETVLFCGDLNTPPTHGLYRQIERVAKNAFASAGSGFGYTFSSKRPLTRIDHVWTKGLEPVWCSPGPSFGSDHRCVIAVVK